MPALVAARELLLYPTRLHHLHRRHHHKYSVVCHRVDDHWQLPKSVVEFLQLDAFRFQTQIIGDSDGPVGVPEPGSAALLSAGAAALLLSRRKVVLPIRAGNGKPALQSQGSISMPLTKTQPRECRAQRKG